MFNRVFHEKNRPFWGKTHYFWKHPYRWWFQTFFSFIPKIGEDEPILTHIFQMGWFNHQLEHRHFTGKQRQQDPGCWWWLCFFRGGGNEIIFGLCFGATMLYLIYGNSVECRSKKQLPTMYDEMGWSFFQMWYCMSTWMEACSCLFCQKDSIDNLSRCLGWLDFTSIYSCFFPITFGAP